MKRLSQLFFFSLLFLAAPMQANLHESHIALFQINYVEEENRLEIMIKAINHDLAVVLEKMTESRIDLDNPDPTFKTDSLIHTYTKEHFKISQGEKELDLKFVGWEPDEKDIFSVWTYLEVADFKPEGELLINCTYLLADFVAQENKLQLRIAETNTAQLLNRDKTSIKLNL